MEKVPKRGTFYLNRTSGKGVIYMAGNHEPASVKAKRITKSGSREVVKTKTPLQIKKIDPIKPTAVKKLPEKTVKEIKPKPTKPQAVSKLVPVPKPETKSVLTKKHSKKTKQLELSNDFFLKRTKILKNAKRNFKAGRTLAVIGLTALIIAYGPTVWHWGLKRMGIPTNTQVIGETFLNVNADEVVTFKPPYQPAYDSSLPTENRLMIKSVGINTPIHEASEDNYEEALKKGVWREAKFGTPSDRKSPTILAAHRFGYLAWSIPYRLKNSFFNLPKLKEGDEVEIIWRQRKYVYKIYAEEKGEGSSEWKNADLVLYTCQDLTSPVRIFRYAKLQEI